jgi:hypothetical protein
LESYHPYLEPQKVKKKIQKFIAFTTISPKTQKAVLASLAL